MGEKNAVKIVDLILQQNAVLKEKNKQLEDMILSLGQTKRLWSGSMSKMSHDIRTPMNAIVGFTAIAQEEKGNPQRTKECLKQIEDATLYLISLINEFTDVSLETAEQSEFSIMKILEEVEEHFMIRSKENRVTFKIDKTNLRDDHIIGNQLQVKQVLTEILNNAFWLTDQNGKIILCAETLAENKEKTIICFRIINTGIGINETFIEQTFLPFEEEEELAEASEKQKTGLSVVNSLVSMLNGIIKVESRAGNETIIKVELPFRRQEKKPQDVRRVSGMQDSKLPDQSSKVLLIQEKGEEKYQFSGQHILLAEDNELNSEIMETYLKQSDLQVDTALNGQTALDYFVNSREGYYSLILMDIRMPVLDGRTATRIIRELPRSDAAGIPIIAMSADAFSDEIKYAQSIGMNEYLTKPIYKEALYQMLSKYINTIEKEKKNV